MSLPDRIDSMEGDIVVGAPDYEVSKDGIYLLLELVPCCKSDDKSQLCAFLGVTVLGFDPIEVYDEGSS